MRRRSWRVKLRTSTVNGSTGHRRRNASTDRRQLAARVRFFLLLVLGRAAVPSGVGRLFAAIHSDDASYVDDHNNAVSSSNERSNLITTRELDRLSTRRSWFSRPPQTRKSIITILLSARSGTLALLRSNDSTDRAHAAADSSASWVVRPRARTALTSQPRSVIFLPKPISNKSSRRPHTSAKENMVWIRSPYPVQNRTLDYVQNLPGISLSEGTAVIQFSRKSDHSLRRYKPHCGKNALSRNGKESFKRFLDSEADDFQNLNSSSLSTDTSFVKICSLRCTVFTQSC